MPLSLFSPQQLDAIVKTTLVDVPPDHHLALVATVDMQGIPVVVSFTNEKGPWTARASFAFRHDWNGSNTIGASVMFSR